MQNAWTYDVMCPIYVDGALWGAMDGGIYNYTVDTIVSKIRKVAAAVTIIMLIISGTLMILYCNYEFNAMKEIVKICNGMGKGDFTVNIPQSF